MPKRALLALGLAVLSSVTVSTFSASATPLGTDARPQTQPTPAGGVASVPVPVLNWAPCDTSGDGYQCTTAQVPLDYSQPQGAKVTLSLIRKPATVPSQRIGSLFTNPGGPGLAASLMVRDLGENAPVELRERYDIVGFDPRAVGGSTPKVSCVTLPEYAEQWAATPGRLSSGGFERAVTFGKRFSDGCVANNAALLPHLGTENTARDMDLLRAAVGDEQLNFFGFSYGTYLGTVYANLFPQRTRVLALDGAVGPDSFVNRPYDNNHRQYVAAEASLNRFFAWCTKSPADCSFGDGRPADAFRRLQASLDVTPVRDANGKVVARGGLFTFWVSLELGYGQSNWSWLATELQKAATTRSGALVSPMSDAYTRYMNLNTAIECADRRFPQDVNLLRGKLAAAIQAAPLLGPALAHGPANYDQGHAQACAQWPAERKSSYAGPWNAPGAATALVIGTTHDPDVPFQDAVELTNALDNARLLTFEGTTHTTWHYSACTRSIITRYLIDGTLPPHHTVCADEPMPTR
ncbi:TAP domain protein [Kribbella flavida DSM 17836]|uniref:TAP domain protein n=1 Tax=Kribbella flavida (strain DSM 17836 / JCM 10339 / NBRC 14399) TaxID=479435 RepID=D2PV82_KRIFD|nr:alpha/beta hydrolase [Kribbella flavida]ADB33363.1 TAP domain protein [Kribbella flavida DSM 17836]